MSLATVLAVDALEAALTGITGLPASVRRNDIRIADFVPSGTPGVGVMLALADDDWDVDAVAFGGGEYEMLVGVELLFAVEGLPGNDVNAVFNAGVEAIRDVLFPAPARLPLTVAGKFEDLRVMGPVERHRFTAEGGAPPVEAVKVRLGLLLTAPTPFG